ncbi:MAG TPA: magnesium transporter, partial [Pseudohaliea sp.]|nr:magnesium transporter [Pseudohaliea sp.]
MTSAEPHSHKPLDRVTRALEEGTLGDVSRMLRKMEPADAAHILESSPPRSRQVLWQLIDDDLQGEVLNELGDELQLEFLRALEPAQVAQLTEGLDDDDVADILQQLPDEVTFEVLEAMDHQDRA